MKAQKPDKTPSWAVALLAAILEPEAARSQEPSQRGMAARRAQQFIDEVPKLLNPKKFENLATEEMEEVFKKDTQEREALRKSWGLSPSIRAVVRQTENADQEMSQRILQSPARKTAADDNESSARYLTFEDASHEKWCLHKTRLRLVRFMEKADYPKIFITLNEISREAYLKAVESNKKAKRSKDAIRKAIKRANQVPEPSKRNRARTKSPD